MEKGMKIAVIALGALMVAALIFGIGYAIWERTGEIPTKYENYSDIMSGEGLISDTDETPNEYYIFDASSLNSSNIFMVFKDGNFSYSMGGSGMASGEYTVDKNVISLNYSSNTSDEGSSVASMVVDGDLLFFVSSICTGDAIPSGKTFNAVVTRRTNNEEAYEYTFREDGSYDLKFGKRKGRNEWTTVSGHYTVNDDGTVSRTLINLSTGVESDTLPLYIYKGHLVDSFYTAITEEEYIEYISAEAETETE